MGFSASLLLHKVQLCPARFCTQCTAHGKAPLCRVGGGDVGAVF